MPQQMAARLTAEKEAIEQDLAAATAESRDSHSKVGHLKERFNEMLERLRPPRFGEQELSDINPNTYLPVYHGRPFVEVSSPGLGDPDQRLARVGSPSDSGRARAETATDPGHRWIE